MLKCLRTDAGHSDFRHLVAELDVELKIRDGADHDFYHQFNGIEDIRNAVVFYVNEQAVACGAFKPYDAQAVEIKRMYVQPLFRAKGIATQVLKELETWCSELGYKTCVLETGIKQPEAIALYRKNTYVQIENYGQYADVADSLCFQKHLS